MRIGIVGYGVVGSAISRLFSSHPDHDVLIYDKFRSPHHTAEHRAAINTCDLTFVCVPTPVGADGMSCDASAVDECVGWIDTPMCIRSTIVPGTLDRLVTSTGKALAFSPEYLGEQASHPWREEGSCGFMIIGGSENLCNLIGSAYQGVPGLTMNIYQTTAATAEMCKYMENCFLATKVAFVNQFYDIAQVFNIDFAELRKLWLVDPRIGKSHSSVTEERGFRGRCLPKDLSAMVAVMRLHGCAPLLETVLTYNMNLCNGSDKKRERDQFIARS